MYKDSVVFLEVQREAFFGRRRQVSKETAVFRQCRGRGGANGK